MNRTLAHAHSEPISERDAAWFEELAGAIDRARFALYIRAQAGHADAALSLTALADAGQPADSPECKALVRLLLKDSRPLDPPATAARLVGLARSGHAIRDACAGVTHDALTFLLDTPNRDGGWSASAPVSRRERSCPRATGCVLEALGHFGLRVKQPLVGTAVKCLLATQDDDGAWVGTPQVLAGLRAVGFDMYSLVVRRAVRWLKEVQNEDGGWSAGEGESTATQTALALVGLLVAGEAESEEVRAGAEFLVGTQRADGSWGEESCFPLAALGRYTLALGLPLPAEPEHTPTEIGTPRRGIAA